jgi:hypothetical protein
MKVKYANTKVSYWTLEVPTLMTHNYKIHIHVILPPSPQSSKRAFSEVSISNSVQNPFLPHSSLFGVTVKVLCTYIRHEVPCYIISTLLAYFFLLRLLKLDVMLHTHTSEKIILLYIQKFAILESIQHNSFEVSWYSDGLWTGQLWFNSQQKQETLPFSIATRLALGTTQPSHAYWGSFPGVKVTGA